MDVAILSPMARLRLVTGPGHLGYTGLLTASRQRLRNDVTRLTHVLCIPFLLI